MRPSGLFWPPWGLGLIKGDRCELLPESGDRPGESDDSADDDGFQNGAGASSR